VSYRILTFITFLTITCLVGVDASAFSGTEIIIMESAGNFFIVPPKEKPLTINNSSLHEKILKKDPGLFILDVRSEKDYNVKKINTHNAIPMENISPRVLFKESSLTKLPVDKDIVIVCYTDRLSNRILPLLHMLGYRAQVLIDGFEGWEEEGLGIK
jgi:rhodanese-related sulfurtransferase